jgi:peptidyl-prolyl cis-trans isomerase D
MKDTLSFRKLFSLLFIAGIAVVFTLQFGPGSNGCAAPLGRIESSSAALVNGKEISVQEFTQSYARYMNIMRSQGQPISDALARQFGLPQQVLNQLVDTELLSQAATDRGIRPSDEELARIIHRQPDFQKDGRFDPEQYRQMLRDYYRKTPPQYEAELRQQLAAQMMLDTLEATASVSDDEVRARFLKEGNTAQLTFVRFAPTMFVDQVKEPSKQELERFAEAEGEKIEAHYEQNRYLYNQPEQVRARHILIRVPENASPEQQQAAQERLAGIRTQVVEGELDFAAAAEEHSEDPGSKVQGGDLGFNTADAWVKPFSDAAFSLEAGAVSEPVRTQFGFHLIKVEEKRPPQSKELAEVREEIAAQLWKRERAKALARQEAERALAELKAGKDLTALYPAQDQAAGALPFELVQKPQATETGTFNAAVATIPRLGPAPELLPDLFARTTTGPLDRVYPAGDAHVVATITERKQPADEDFEAQKEELRAEARQAKQYELREQFLKSLREQGRVVMNQDAVDQLLGPAS